MSKIRRICFLGLPRCGSQYVSKLFCVNQPDECINLGEPFTPGHIGSVNILESIVCDIESTELPSTLTEQADLVIEKLKRLPTDKTIVLKLFFAEMGKEIYTKIIEALKELNFQFLILKRLDPFEHWLSYIIATIVGKWDNMDSVYNNDILTVPISTITYYDWLFFKIQYFESILEDLNVSTYPLVRYEHAITDLESIFDMKFDKKPQIKKMSELSNSERIKNVDELRQHWNFLSIAVHKKKAYV